MKKTATYVMLALFVVGIVAAGVSAFQGEDRGAMTGNQLNQRIRDQVPQETRDAMHEAIETGNYQAFLDVKSGLDVQPRMMQHIQTEEQFNLMVQMHNARQNNDLETAGQIREQLGMGSFGKRAGSRNCDCQ